MSKGNHDTLVYRLSQMLVKLNQGEKLNPHDLAGEFGVNIRTVQRDLNVRFAYLPLIKDKGLYSIDPLFLGKLSSRDIQRFASLAGVRNLFPSLSDEFLQEIFNQSQQPLLVKGHHYEDLTGKEALFKELESSIADNELISFSYNKGGLCKSYSDVEPYKLVNNKGIWYLLAKDEGKVKTYSFTKISNLNREGNFFHKDDSIEKMIKEDDGVWLGEEKKRSFSRFQAE